MSYSISLSGHGPNGDDLKEVFENTVRALRAVNPDGSGPSGSLSGSSGDGTSFPSVSASDVADVSDPADAAADPGEDDAAIADQPPTTEG